MDHTNNRGSPSKPPSQPSSHPSRTYNVTIKSFRAWRQAALFKFVLEQVRSGSVDADHGAEQRAFAQYVDSGCEARGQLPFDADFVRYPQTLLD